MRDLQADDQQQSHDEKARNLWQMPKNTQKSVDSISDIRFNAGMDARKMKKVILYNALVNFETYLVNLTSNNRDPEYVYGIMLDERATSGQIRRFQRILSQMIDDAESKI